MYDEYEESFYYDKPRSVGSEVSGEAVAQGLGLGVGLFGIVLSVLVFIVSRMDLLSSTILGLLFYMLAYQNGWDKSVYVISVIAIIAVSMLLQHFLKVFQIVYGLFTCVVAALLGPIIIGYDSEARMYLIMVICFGVTALYRFVSWKNR